MLRTLLYSQSEALIFGFDLLYRHGWLIEYGGSLKAGAVSIVFFPYSKAIIE